MKLSHTTVLAGTLILTSLGIGQSAQAGFFYSEYIIGSYDWWEDNYEDTWVYFGGCEEQDNGACVSDTDTVDSLLIGDYNVKQGAYALSVANNNHTHGKLVLSYGYRFLTEETADNTTDVGYVKLKDVETNEIYYLATLTPADQTKGWKNVRVALAGDLVGRPLQLVTEIMNDGERLSTIGINYITLTHASEPVIRGTVYETVAGKNIPLEGVTIKLQNRARTKTYAQTTTVVQSDTEDTYTFWPLLPKKKFTIVASYNGVEQTLNVKKMKYGQYKADEDFTF